MFNGKGLKKKKVPKHEKDAMDKRGIYRTN